MSAARRFSAAPPGEANPLANRASEVSPHAWYWWLTRHTGIRQGLHTDRSRRISDWGASPTMMLPEGANIMSLMSIKAKAR
jgi:hypothetical protein